MSEDEKPAKSADIVTFSHSGPKADEHRHARREAKAKDLKSRFSAARTSGKGDAASKYKAAQKLKKLFKRPGSGPDNKA